MNDSALVSWPFHSCVFFFFSRFRVGTGKQASKDRVRTVEMTLTGKLSATNRTPAVSTRVDSQQDFAQSLPKRRIIRLLFYAPHTGPACRPHVSNYRKHTRFQLPGLQRKKKKEFTKGTGKRVHQGLLARDSRFPFSIVLIVSELHMLTQTRAKANSISTATCVNAYFFLFTERALSQW